MKFSSESIKLKSKAHNEDFCFDLETPRGHFFAVLDFGAHDYSNLNSTLKGKLETIVGSFVSLSRFSAELFLGFLAKEINNFLHNLGEQSGGPELLASGALCLVNGNRLTYFLCGDVQMNVVNDGRILPLYGTATGESPSAASANAGIERLGARNQEGPLTDVVQSFTLQDADLVLLMTRGLHEVFGGRKLAEEIASAGSTDPKVICDALMKSGASAREDRSLVVMGGPYEKYVDPVLADLSKAVAALESRMDALSENDQSKKSNQVQAEQRIDQQLEVLKDDLRSKAAKIDLLKLDERVKSLAKGQLQRPNLDDPGVTFQPDAQRRDMDHVIDVGQQPGISPVRVALLVLGAALLGSLIGGWTQSGNTKGAAEVWSVKTADNQITINRLDGEQATVTLDVAQPLNATGEQKFSSFADAKRYIDTVITSSSVSNPPAQGVNSPATAEKKQAAVTEIELRQGDTLQEIADRYKIPLEKLMSLNPRITRRTGLQIGQKIIVPTAAVAVPVAQPTQ
ncbi:MAG: LysM peptidoglycan-binding domain-containing protein [bacterium]